MRPQREITPQIEAFAEKMSSLSPYKKGSELAEEHISKEAYLTAYIQNDFLAKKIEDLIVKTASIEDLKKQDNTIRKFTNKYTADLLDYQALYEHSISKLNPVQKPAIASPVVKQKM